MKLKYSKVPQSTPDIPQITPSILKSTPNILKSIFNIVLKSGQKWPNMVIFYIFQYNLLQCAVGRKLQRPVLRRQLVLDLYSHLSHDNDMNIS